MAWEVGDLVVITEGVKQCAYGCNDEMTSMIGSTRIIESRLWDSDRMINRYGLRKTSWMWCDKCFESAEPCVVVDVDRLL